MATAPWVSVETYLHTSYRPDCDYVDGAVLERNLGQFTHSMLQMLVLVAIQSHAAEWRVLALPEQRLKIRAGRYRVPDVMVLAADAPRTPVIEHPPLLCIEIVSPDDRMKDLIERSSDYLALGVPETWILDPVANRAYVFSEAGLREVTADDRQLVCGKISLDLPALFAQLD